MSSNNVKNCNKTIPLAEQLRPKSWHEVVGQSHLLGHGKPLYQAFKQGKPHSMIFWGPPGVGKTTLAFLCAKEFDCDWISLSAVLVGVKDIRQAAVTAEKNSQKGRHTILFIDEIHRFNKAQQDALLPFTERGLLTFIGATTENPSFEVNAALLSRSAVYTLNPLRHDDLEELLNRAISFLGGVPCLEEQAKLFVIDTADGDGRRLYNVLQVLSQSNDSSRPLTQEEVKHYIQSRYRRFDKGGDQFYDQISALHKAVRGSSPDAALYWFCRMIDGGADPKYLARRIIRMAWEEIGLADPRALQIANYAADTYERLGTPEGELALGQAVLYLSIAAKSNAGYMAYKKACSFVAQDQSRAVPLHLRNAPTSLMKKHGYGEQYQYAHDAPHAYVAGENYFPEGMESQNWYKPVDRGLETKINEKLKFLQKLDERVKNKVT